MQQPNQEKLLKDQVDTIYSNAVSANLTLFLAAIVFILLFHDSNINQVWLFSWSCALSFMAMIRLLTRQLRIKYPELYSDAAWSNIYTFHTCILGCIWASSSFFAIQANDLFEVGVIYIVVFSVITAAVPVLSASPKAFYGYIAPPAFVLSVIPFFAEIIPLFLSLSTVLITIFSISTSKILRNRIDQVFSLQYENEDLEHEILERQVTEESLRHLAHHDVLTNLPNRLLLDKRLKQAIANKQISDDSKLAVLYIDLDNFKNINDGLGHVIGDKLLQEVSLRLIEGVRLEDTIARVGGDEFIMILDNVSDVEGISDFTQKIMSIINTPIHIDNNDLHISSSIGISIYPDDGKTPEELMKYADAAMFKAKKSGRHNFQFYTKDLTASALEKIKIQNELIIALQEDQFEVFYQIQISLLTRKIIGVEALVRWNHPIQGILAPAMFLDHAKESGLLASIGTIVLRKSCEQMALWKSDNIDIGRVAVNIAGVQIQSLELANTVNNLCHSTGCKPEWLELEVTEDFIMQESGKSIETLNKLRGLGIQLAIDDFGTGYSSLSYLKKLPINKLKIDRSFIRDIETDPDDAAIVKSIVALGKALNLKVLAEGVEDKHQEDFLINEGCDIAQGYYYSKPVEASQITALYNHFNNASIIDAKRN